MAKYTAVWDCENLIDGLGFNCVEDAIECCTNVLLGWIEMFNAEHSERNESFVEDWDKMVQNNCVWVAKVSDDLYEDEIVWEPTAEELNRIGWVEFNKF